MAKKVQGKTDKDEAFCQAYIVSWNGTQAAVDAGFSKKRNSAATIAYRLLRNVEIRARIKKLMKDKLMEQEEVLARLADQARSTLLPFIEIDKDGFVYFDFSDPEALRHLHLVKRIKTKRQRFVRGRGKAAEDWEGEWVEVELHDSQKALELIGKYYSLFVDKDKEGNPLQPVVNIYMPDNNRK